MSAVFLKTLLDNFINRNIMRIGNTFIYNANLPYIFSAIFIILILIVCVGLFFYNVIRGTTKFTNWYSGVEKYAIIQIENIDSNSRIEQFYIPDLVGSIIFLILISLILRYHLTIVKAFKKKETEK